MHSKVPANDAVRAFSIYAEDYDSWFDGPKGRVLFAMELKTIRVLMKDLIQPFLEIGVGSGRFAAALGIRYGVDPSEALLEMAIKRGVKGERAFGEKLPFPDNIFGGVFILFTLCFIKEPGMVIAEARRILKNGGGLILGIINRESPWGNLYQAKKAEGHPLYRHARFFSMSEVETVLHASGMKVDACSSTLCQRPSDSPHEEAVHDRFVDGAGFVGIRASKLTPQRANGN